MHFSVYNSLLPPKKTQGSPLLPPEIVLLIIDGLPRGDIYSFAMTCRHLQSICLPIYLQKRGLDIAIPSIHLRSSHFDAPLRGLAHSSLLNGMDFEEIICTLPSCVPLTNGSVNDLITLKRVLSKLNFVKRLSITFCLSIPGMDATWAPKTSIKWLIALSDLLSLAACRAGSIHLSGEGQSGLTLLLPTPLLRLWCKSTFPGKPLVEELNISTPILILQVPALTLLSSTSVTSLKLSSSTGLTATYLDSVHLPNLHHFEMLGYELHPTASLHALLSRHTLLDTLALNLGLYPSLRHSWPISQSKISSSILPNLTSISADVATALWILQNPQSLPTTKSIKIVAGTVWSNWLGHERNPHLQNQLWPQLASRGTGSMFDTLILCGTHIVSRLLGVLSPSYLPESPLTMVKSLTLEGGRLDWPKNADTDPNAYILQAEALRALPGWILRLFPSLQTLDIHNLVLIVSPSAEEEFVASMTALCPNVAILHDIQRLLPIRQTST